MERDSLSAGWGLGAGGGETILADDFRPDDVFERVCFDFVRAASIDPTTVPEVGSAHD